MIKKHLLLLNPLLTAALLSPTLALPSPPTADCPHSLAAASESTLLEDLRGTLGFSNEDRSLQGLLPLLSEGQELLFIQGHWHHQKPRHLLGMGLGHRLLWDAQWGVGYNLFFDHDNSHHHHRLGLGGELWVDWIKLAVNGYLPVSSQRAVAKQPVTSRPAKGFDLGLQGYLPHHPQLGATLGYAYSVGEQIAGHASAPRKKNPKNWSMGFSYTPVPLVTIAYSHQTNSLYRQGGDHRIGATVTYQLGTPLAQQCDPTQVAQLRSLSGQLLSPVSRQYDMLLSYRTVKKQEVKQSSHQAAGLAKPNNRPAIPSTAAPKPNNTPAIPSTPNNQPWSPRPFTTFDPTWQPTNTL